MTDKLEDLLTQYAAMEDEPESLEYMAEFYATMEAPDSEPLGWTLVLPHHKVLDKAGELLPDIEEWTRDNLQEKLLVISLLPPGQILFGNSSSLNMAPVQLHFRTEQDYVLFKMWWE